MKAYNIIDSTLIKNIADKVDNIEIKKTKLDKDKYNTIKPYIEEIHKKEVLINGKFLSAKSMAKELLYNMISKGAIDKSDIDDDEDITQIILSCQKYIKEHSTTKDSLLEALKARMMDLSTGEINDILGKSKNTKKIWKALITELTELTDKGILPEGLDIKLISKKER